MDYTAPTCDEIADLARKTANGFPAPFAAAAREVIIAVDEFPSDEMLDDLEEEADAFSLTGLYVGVPLTLKSFGEGGEPDTVWLFRRGILDEWAERGNVTIAELVAHVTVHEFAHHFGWSDADIASIDRWWE